MSFQRRVRKALVVESAPEPGAGTRAGAGPSCRTGPGAMPELALAVERLCLWGYCWICC